MIAHDPSTIAGRECPACEYTLPAPRGYLVIGAAGPGVAVCGHYLAEHGAADYGTAVQLATDIRRSGVPYVALYAPDGALVSATTGPDGYAVGPFSATPEPGTRCSACGVDWGRFISVAPSR